MRERGAIAVVSCYELGRQPLAAATSVAFLREAGFDPIAVDLAVESWDRLDGLGDCRLALVSVPMHTALHLGVRAARRLREVAPAAHVCLYGHYALLNAGWLLAGPANSVVGGEAEAALVALARAIESGAGADTVAGIGLADRPAGPVLERLPYLAPARDAFPPLARYARLAVTRDAAVDGADAPAGVERLVAAVETTRGCLHVCRHCPLPPVYGGRFFAVPVEVVLDDIGHAVEAGARHVTFADPDFLNGPTHAMRVTEALHERWPGLSFDFTAKVEHLLRERELLPDLTARGCLFVVSAVESLSPTVLGHLDKGHEAGDAARVLAACRGAGIALRPTFVPFTPWTTARDYLDLVEWVEGEGLVDHVDPVQWSIRLLVPPGSLLEAHPAMTPHLRGLDAARFSWRWQHPDPAMDRLHEEIDGVVRRGVRGGDPAAAILLAVRRAARRAAGLDDGPPELTIPAARLHAPPPRITEPWFC